MIPPGSGTVDREGDSCILNGIVDMDRRRSKGKSEGDAVSRELDPPGEREWRHMVRICSLDFAGQSLFLAGPILNFSGENDYWFDN